MRALNKRLAAVEDRQPHKRPRVICLKGTEGEETDTAGIMEAAGLAPSAEDAVVVIKKPAGTGGEDRVLMWEALR